MSRQKHTRNNELKTSSPTRCKSQSLQRSKDYFIFCSFFSVSLSAVISFTNSIYAVMTLLRSIQIIICSEWDLHCPHDVHRGREHLHVHAARAQGSGYHWCNAHAGETVGHRRYTPEGGVHPLGQSPAKPRVVATAVIMVHSLGE